MRNLPKELKDYFDSKIPKLEGMPAQNLLLLAAKSCVGITEIGGDNKGPMVELFQKDVGQAMGQSWCLDFLQSVISYVENEQGITSPLAATESVVDLWNRSKNYCAIVNPIPGDIILWQKAGTATGHCGMIIAADSYNYYTIEGNTSDSQDIERNGDGVFAKKRPKGGLKTFIELGFLRVFP